MTTGIIIVDHGSRMTESNQLLESVAAAFGSRFQTRFPIVEPAHMELAQPSIADAYAKCVQRGATHVTVVPYFLGPGKHWTHDIPALAAAAAVAHPGTTFNVTGSLGLDNALLDLLARRIEESKHQTAPK
jgi:sirohydrochlorin ferrochelatase